MGVVYAFVAIAPFLWVCVGAVAGLGNVRITKSVNLSENATEGSYLVGLVRGKGRGRGIEGRGQEKGAGTVREGEVGSSGVV